MSGGDGPCGAPPGMGSAQDCAPPGGGSVGGVNGSGNWAPPAASTYVVNSKIMVVAVAVLFAVVVFILCLHVYAKWFWRHHQGQSAAAAAAAGDFGHGQAPGRRTRRSWRMRRRRESRVLSPGAAQMVVVQSVGLEKAVVDALPTFEFVTGEEAGAAVLECAVCLEDFEPGEKGRTLPKCGHHFHLECVDMWLFSHSTCPLCRASVRPDEPKRTDTPIGDAHSHPVIGDVQAPFMAAMRASRRQRQRSRSSSQLPPSLPPISQSDAPDAPTQPSTAPHESSHATPTPAVDPKALAREYEFLPAGEIPSNVLVWGDHMSSTTPPPQGPQQPGASSIRAPFHVTVDIPRLAHQNASALYPANVMSPMARASASFRRLLSRGKSVVSPHDDDDDDDNDNNDAVDEGGPSSHSPRGPPPPQNAP